MEHLVAQSFPWGYIDAMEIDPSGLLRVRGWTRTISDLPPAPRVTCNEQVLEPFAAYRTFRPDVASAHSAAHMFLGFVYEFLVPPDVGSEPLQISLFQESTMLLRVNEILSIRTPDYARLFCETTVLHRDDIYGSGPPVRSVTPEVVELVRHLPGPILDYGCGAGVLVERLRQMGIHAHGLELSRPAIVESLSDEVRPHVTLYDGRSPAPFESESFETVTCIEVLEHLPNYRAALEDIARIARRHVLITVPDMSAIPLCHRHQVVPWHLLESTHVNFFTQSSLLELLRRHFSDVQSARIAPVEVNGTRFYTSLAAICTK